MTQKIKALIVDDSALVRDVLTKVLSSDRGIEVVGTAPDPLIARDKIKALNPDVITLDVEMPKMDGISFLRNLMRLRPMPVVMISSLTEAGAEVTLEALDLGAVDFVTKPSVGIADGLDEYAIDIIAKVKAAAGAKVRSLSEKKEIRVTPKFSADAVLAPSKRSGRLKTTEKIIAIGASTGGTEAIKEVMMAMPADAPAVVIAQHIPAAFSAAFAKRMNGVSPMTVLEPQDGDQILPGHAYIAPGDQHLMVTRSGARYICKLSDGPAVNRHRPSVDVLFRSVAQCVGVNAVGVILTGMGNDGATGLKELLDAGAMTIAQDESTSVVWGMPGEAVKLGAAQQVVGLPQVAETILTLLHKGYGLKRAVGS